MMQNLPGNLVLHQVAAALPINIEWLPKQPYVATDDSTTTPGYSLTQILNHLLKTLMKRLRYIFEEAVFGPKASVTVFP
jgi:hypothetical protein